MSRAERRRRMLALDSRRRRCRSCSRAWRRARPSTIRRWRCSELFGHPAAELAQREPGLAKMPRELRGSYGVGMDPDDVDSGHASSRSTSTMVREMHRRGVVIVAGTDIGVPGHSLDRELELYVEAGFTPLRR